MSPDAIRRVLHELQVHQIELEMQNDELRRTQGRLHTSRARYFDLYDLAPVGYCTLSADGLILEANLSIIGMLGTTREALVKQPITRFFHKDDQDIYYLHRKKFMASHGPHACELRMVRKDGEPFWVQLTATDVPTTYLEAGNDEEETAISRLVLTDISDIKRVEDDKTQLATQLHQAKRLETLGILAAGLSHDFNNLLTTIMGYASAGSVVAEGNDELTGFFGGIESSALRATELIRQLLAYSGKAKWTLEEVDVGIVVKEICHTLAISLPRNVTLTCDLADRVPFWKGDSTQVFQILMNLVINAFEAFPEGIAGEITLRTRAEGISDSISGPGIWILPVVPGRYVVLEVADTGCGMTPDLLYHAFEPFYTTKSMGRGLGLAAVQGILSSHGGGLRVSTAPGCGASFKVYLPAMIETRVDSGGDVLSTWRGEGLILIVDYENAGRSIARNMAERFGFTVLEAQGGLDAVEQFRLRHGELVLVFLDRGLRGTSARDTFRRIQEIDRQVPVVFTSGYDARDPESRREGQSETLRKPYRPAEFEGMLHRALMRPSLHSD
jgi:PAS domain S-box-containing protein